MYVSPVMWWTTRVPPSMNSKISFILFSSVSVVGLPPPHYDYIVLRYRVQVENPIISIVLCFLLRIFRLGSSAAPLPQQRDPVELRSPPERIFSRTEQTPDTPLRLGSASRETDLAQRFGNNWPLHDIGQSSTPDHPRI